MSPRGATAPVEQQDIQRVQNLLEDILHVLAKIHDRLLVVSPLPEVKK